MTEIVELRKPAFLADRNRLVVFNRLVQTRSTLMPHEVSTSTGCSHYEATELLFRLHSMGYAEPFLLVYHKDHLDSPVTARKLGEGFPHVPFICDVCDEVIRTSDDLMFDLSFKIKPEITFEFISDGNDKAGSGRSY